jgi:hypothetical protein
VNVTGISYSSDKKLVRCEQSYHYRYDEKLKPRIKSKGLYMGDVLHRLLEAHRLKKDWKKVFNKFKKEEWNKLFEEERERYAEKDFTPAIVLDLMSHYVDHWASQDSLVEPLYIEKGFELMVKLDEAIRVPIRFKSDFISKTGKEIILWENKNKKKIPEPDERILSPQPHAYCYLLSKLPKPIIITKIIWDYIRTTPVPAPQILKDGSLSKREINTDQRSYLRALKEAKIHPKGDEVIGLENHLKTLPETLTLARVTNTPNLRVGESFVRDWIDRARRARGIKRPTRNWDRSCSRMCDYQNLCMADLLGKPDRNTIIKKDFVISIKPAEEEIEEEDPNAGD